MCGIFGFVLKKPVRTDKVFKLLGKLEVHQYPSEPKPVGGYGAGVAIPRNDRTVVIEKVGSVNGSPVTKLSKTVNVNEASILVGHVRYPSEEFLETAKFKETAQPYLAKCRSGLTVISVHNGYVVNYKEIREKLCDKHVFESEKLELIDSEVIPHFFEEKLKEKGNVNDALDAVFLNLEGSSAIGILQISARDAFLHFVHKGKTRGLKVWTNKNDEIVFCSRKEPLTAEFGRILVEREFEEKVSIQWREDASLKLSFPINF